MKWIGLTGGIGSGKSTAAEWLKSKGFEVVNADHRAHQALGQEDPSYQKILEHFGSQILDQSGEINRSKLGDIVFKSEDERRFLEGVIHPRVRELAKVRRESIAANGAEIAFYDVPLLFETGIEKEFDSIVLIATDREIQIQRVSQRDGLSAEDISRRIDAQLPMDEKIKRSPIVVWNNGSRNELEKDLEKVLQDLLPPPTISK